MNKYAIFLKIIELGSLSKAATFLNYSQSAVSQAVNALEKEMGMTLLNRNHHGVSLTSDGSQLLPYIQQLATAFQQLNDQAARLTGLTTGLVRIGTFSSVSTAVLAPLMQQLKQAYPHISLELLTGDYSEIESWILAGTVDFGFVALPTKKALTTIPFIDDDMLAIVPSDSPLSHYTCLPLARFEEHPVIMLTEGEKRGVLELFKQHHIHADIQYITQDDYTIMAMVENHLGISVLGEMITRRTNYHIQTVPLDPPLTRHISIAFSQRKQLSIAANEVVQFLKRHAPAAH